MAVASAMFVAHYSVRCCLDLCVTDQIPLVESTAAKCVYSQVCCMTDNDSMLTLSHQLRIKNGKEVPGSVLRAKATVTCTMYTHKLYTIII